MSMICETCGRMPHACACNMSYAERLRSITLGAGTTPTRTKRAYEDTESLRATFGPDSREQFMDETRGKGAFYRSASSPTGFVWKDRKNQRYEPVTEKAAREVLPNLLGAE